jgi:hypothetical protein
LDPFIVVNITDDVVVIGISREQRVIPIILSDSKFKTLNLVNDLRSHYVKDTFVFLDHIGVRGFC